MPSDPIACREHGRHCAEVAARLTDPKRRSMLWRGSNSLPILKRGEPPKKLALSRNERQAQKGNDRGAVRHDALLMNGDFTCCGPRSSY
jgi:hypothetical protein